MKISLSAALLFLAVPGAALASDQAYRDAVAKLQQ